MKEPLPWYKIRVERTKDVKPVENPFDLYDCELEEKAREVLAADWKATEHKCAGGLGKSHAEQEAKKLRAIIKLRPYLDRVIMEFEREYFVTLNDKYIYALASGNWCVKGKKVWYQSKSVPHFIENYILKSPFDK